MSSLRRLGALLVMCAASVALAHATLVLGTASFEAAAPDAGGGSALIVRLHDPSLVEVEDAIVFIELTPVGSAQQPLTTDRLDEVEPGVYAATLPRLVAGEYRMRVVDRTFRQEEAIAEVDLTLDAAGTGSVAFVLPPTETSQRDLLSWLVWVIGLPLLAGVVVTVLVLRSGSKASAAATTARPDGNS